MNAFRTPGRHSLRRAVALVAVLGGLAPTLAAAQSAAPDFHRDIRPLLARRCFACHGPGHAEGGLRLNERDAALAELDSGSRAIVPGRPDESELLARVAATDEALRMPPEGKPLTPAEVDLLRRWIASGAAWEVHWAFRPRTTPAPPQVPSSDWIRTPIDTFVLSQLRAKGLEPSPPADRIAWLRRATFDLTGLPPSPAEIAAFVADDSPDAYETVIDRLLDSPHYGERWARHWLDLVRYAETNSFERDGVKPNAWRYRDYVIRAFNDDKPYDQFILEQLAGDELPEPTAEQLVATGFYRLGVWDDEPADRELAYFDGLDDVVSTTGQVFLGLTVNCARCHDHKIDPIPQRDYYSLLAFFRGLTPMAYDGPQVLTPIFADATARERFAAAEQTLRAKRDRLQAQITDIEREFRERAALGDVAEPDLEDLEFRFYRDSWTSLPNFDALKPETVGQLDPAYFDLRPATREDSFGFVFNGTLKVPTDGPYTFTLDSDDGARLVVDGRPVIVYDGIHGVGSPRTAVVELRQGRVPVRLDYFQGKHGRGLAVTWSGPGFTGRYLSAATAEGIPVADLKHRPLAQVIKTLGKRVLGGARFEEYTRLRKELDAALKQKPPADYALWVTETGPAPPETFVLTRGSPQAPAEQVEPAFLSVLGGGTPRCAPPADGATSGRRLALARWIASPDNRLTARVMVNRVWQHHFGRGLVRSPNNFGQLGAPPTHPELLDYLAEEFIRGGWRLKPLHRLIMRSSVYRQASRPSPEALARDPLNDALSHFDMRRLSAEEYRDALYAVTGELNRQLYGPSIFPEISAEVLAGQSRPGSGWNTSPPAQQARRSVYIHVKRSLVVPLLSTFDFPETDASCEARFVTVQPSQALAQMNGAFLRARADALAARLRKEAGPDTAAAIRLGIPLALGREANEAEVARGAAFVQQLVESHHVSPDEALRDYCLTLLSRNEFLYLD